MPTADETALVAAVASGRRLAEAVITAWDAGEAIVPINPVLPAAEIDRLLAQVRPTHVVDGDRNRASAAGLPVARDTAAVVVTSGTTGEPKAVELTRSGMEVMARGYSAGLDAGPRDRWLACLPLHHVASLGVLARAYVTAVPWTVHESFDVDRVARAPRDEGATIVSVVPTALRRLLEARAPIEEYRRIVVGGAPCPPGLRAHAESVGATVVDAYGLTETWGGFALDGRTIGGAKARLDPTTGEIFVRGAVVMRGYRLDPARTAEVLDTDGWLATGDIGAFDVDGRLHVVDRRKDLVITGGVNVSPTAVEAVLIRHPDVDDVCVIGVPDDDWGERVVACVVPCPDTPPPTVDELRAFGRRHLAAPQLPREVRIVSEIPRSAGGKPLRRLLRP
jgi:O-succinylbenzoic acid--CoA ligase